MSANAPPPPSSRSAPQFLRYAGAGAIGTALHYAMLITLVQLARVDAVVASTAGAVGGALVNYVLNHRFTFASDKPHARTLPRFVLVSAAGVALNAAVMAGVLAVVPHYLVAQVVATGAVLVAGFVANRTWTF